MREMPRIRTKGISNYAVIMIIDTLFFVNMDFKRFPIVIKFILVDDFFIPA